MLSKTQLSLIIFFLFNSACLSCYAQPKLEFPIDCIEGKDCWVVNYVDVEPVPNIIRDFACGSRSYDNHKGTDIAIRDWQSMERGVDVLAAADGKVLRLRDGVKDEILSHEQLYKVKEGNKACGNGLFIEHDEGWQTIYCHLKQNSIIVKPGQTVTAGQKLGQVGHSGYVEFPHLHIGVMHDDTLIDPYTGLSNQVGCNKSDQPLWLDNKLSNYNPVSIYASGFSNAVPVFEQIKQDASSPDNLPVDSPALIFWTSIFGVQKNDQIQLKIRDPEDRVFSERKVIQEKTRARQFLYIGKKNKKLILIKGTYTGSVTLIRVLTNGEMIKRSISKELIVR
jgi:murein DD-endopeptidase MepM/ murein hydrolase activator NlpD